MDSIMVRGSLRSHLTMTLCLSVILRCVAQQRLEG